MHKEIWIVVATKGCSIIISGNNLCSGALISSCYAEKSDQQSLQHAIQCIQSMFSKVAVYIVDAIMCDVTPSISSASVEFVNSKFMLGLVWLSLVFMI